nr:hypothetical protein [Tanacetum cinerariifolium]
RLKREAAERAFEAQSEKDHTLMRLEELRFLATSTKDLDDNDAYWIKKQKRLIRNKMRNDFEDLFGHDARPRPAGKPRPAKKTKSDATTSTGESSASTQSGELMEQELRLKREAAERAFEVQAEKNRTFMRLEELRFLPTSTKDLDDADAYWIKKQKRLIRNTMRSDLGNEDDEDE